MSCVVSLQTLDEFSLQRIMRQNYDNIIISCRTCCPGGVSKKDIKVIVINWAWTMRQGLDNNLIFGALFMFMLSWLAVITVACSTAYHNDLVSFFGPTRAACSTAYYNILMSLFASPPTLPMIYICPWNYFWSRLKLMPVILSSNYDCFDESSNYDCFYMTVLIIIGDIAHLN